jgi:DNA polymerase-3 subunit alpha
VEDFLVHNCGKKDRALIAKEREKFVEGCEATGYGEAVGTKLFNIIEPFADYAFNRSHAYGYGLVAYQTAWLKANHPVEYLAALLTSVKDNQDKSAVYLNECRQRGIKVLVPDVNRSASDFTAAHDADEQLIHFGLSAVRNVGEGLVGPIIAEREASGPYVDFHDFCDRVGSQVLNKRTIESLIKAGAFDSLGHERRGLLEVHEVIIDHALARHRERDQGTMNLFDDLDAGAGAFAGKRTEIPATSFDKMTRLQYEKEMLGLYVSDHPLMGVEHLVRRKADATIAELRDSGSGEMKTVGGVVTGLQRKYTKKGELMAVFVLEDLEAAIEVMVFPKTMIEHGSKLADDRIICVRGRLDTREDLVKIVAMEIVPVDVAVDGSAPLRLQFPAHGLDEERIETLKKLLVAHPGPSPVLVAVGSQTIRLSDAFRVDETAGLRAELLTVFGPGALLP